MLIECLNNINKKNENIGVYKIVSQLKSFL